MHSFSFSRPWLALNRRHLVVLGLVMGGAALAQTVVPAVSTGSITSVTVPGTGMAPPSAAAATLGNLMEGGADGKAAGPDAKVRADSGFAI